MGVLFQTATFVRFNYFKAPCFVLCATMKTYGKLLQSEYSRIFYLNRLLTNGSVVSEPLLK